jgi:hypothetical protein
MTVRAGTEAVLGRDKKHICHVTSWFCTLRNTKPVHHARFQCVSSVLVHLPEVQIQDLVSSQPISDRQVLQSVTCCVKQSSFQDGIVA